MSLHRFFVNGRLDTVEGETVELPLSDDDRHHAVDVVRVRVGESVALVDCERSAYEYVVTDIGPDRLVGEYVRALDRPHEPHVTLIQGLTKGTKFDEIVDDAVEIGVEAIWPIAFRRSVQRLDGERARKKGERWRRIAEAAAKQSGRSFVPRVDDPGEQNGLVGRLSGFDLVLLPWEEEASSAPGIREVFESREPDKGLSSDALKVAVIVGPEGGLDDEEVAALRGAGAVVVSLGDTVLRSETAAVVALALTVQEMGGLGAR